MGDNGGQDLITPGNDIPRSNCLLCRDIVRVTGISPSESPSCWSMVAGAGWLRLCIMTGPSSPGILSALWHRCVALCPLCQAQASSWLCSDLWAPLHHPHVTLATDHSDHHTSLMNQGREGELSSMQLTRVLVGFCLLESCSFVLKSLQYHYWCPRGQILSINLHKMAALVKHQGWVTSEGAREWWGVGWLWLLPGPCCPGAGGCCPGPSLVTEARLSLWSNNRGSVRPDTWPGPVTRDLDRSHVYAEACKQRHVPSRVE